jgi:hypothetical protein
VIDTVDNTTSSGGEVSNREALDHAHIDIRPEGRQIVIDRGARSQEVDSGDRGEGKSSEPAVPAEESTITGFSEDSRRRLRDLLHSLKRDAGGLFLTLTYQDLDPVPDKAERDLDTFWKRLERAFPGVGGVWKMEPQDRGVVHFHLMIFGVDFIPVQWLSRIWHDVTGEEGEAHRKSCVDLEAFVNEDGKLQSYMAEYMEETYDVWPGAEPGGPWHTPGRWWGKRGVDNLPFADWRTATVLEEAEAMKLISELLDEWDVDIPSGVVPPSLTINTRGDPTERLDQILDRL